MREGYKTFKLLPESRLRRHLSARTDDTEEPSLALSAREERALEEYGLDVVRIRLAAQAVDLEHYEALLLARGLE